MNDLKRIGNRELLRKLAEALEIEGVEKRSPIEMDTSRLVPTVSILGPNPRIYAENKLQEYTQIDTLVSRTLIRGAYDAGTADFGLRSTDYDLWLDQVNLVISLNPAAMAALAGQYCNLYIARWDEDLTTIVPIVSLRSAWTFDAAVALYDWRLRGSQAYEGQPFTVWRPGGVYVAKGETIIIVATPSGGSFPAATSEYQLSFTAFHTKGRSRIITP